MPILKELLRRYGHAVQEPVIDCHPVVTANDVRLLGAIKVRKGGTENVPWCLAWHGKWRDVEFSPLSRSYARKLDQVPSLYSNTSPSTTPSLSLGPIPNPNPNPIPTSVFTQVAAAMRKGAISLLGNILKDSLDKIVESETGVLKVAFITHFSYP